MTAKKKTDDVAPDPVEELRKEFGDQVTLYPLEGAYIEGVEHREQTVDAERAHELLGYAPPAFTTTQPAPPAASVDMGVAPTANDQADGDVTDPELPAQGGL